MFSSWQETECWQSVLVLFIISVHLGASDCKIGELVAKPNVKQVKFKYHPATKSELGFNKMSSSF